MNGELSFWDGVRNASGQELSLSEKLDFCEGLTKMLKASPELAKIFFNTQVYNEIVNDVTTRGLHSEGVAIVAENLAIKKASLEGRDAIEGKISGLLAKALGYMHDLGHTPFGHDGEDALGKEMERFRATDEYKAKRAKLFGEEYVQQAEDEKVEVMCYEHNETSSIIGARLVEEFARENNVTLNAQAIQYIKTGILAHSTSRVKQEPRGVEQKAVRLADKVAYIPQDLLDLLKQNVLSIDQLNPDEQSLLGLNEAQLTAREQKEYDSYTTEEKKKSYMQERVEYKKELKDKLRHLDEMPSKVKIDFLRQLDVRVAEMQAEIATKCFVEQGDGTYSLDGRKDVVDFFDKAVNKGKIPKDRDLTPQEIMGQSLFRSMRNAQKMPMSDRNREASVNQTSAQYRDFLIKEYGLDPMIATLWVTKAKYQDSFIHTELARTSETPEGTKTYETLSDINKRYDNGWKMKTTFQFFYSNPEQIPADFLEKYQQDGQSVYTDQQIVSAFIASFTNHGLEDLYNGLLQRNLVISRDEAIRQLKEKRPDLDIEKFVNDDMKWKDPQNPKSEYEVSGNDILELLYEEQMGTTIVSGKNQRADIEIPKTAHAIAIRDTIGLNGRNASRTQSVESPLLTSAIDVSRTEVNSNDIKSMVASIMDRQKAQEIDRHIDEVKRAEQSEGR